MKKYRVELELIVQATDKDMAECIGAKAAGKCELQEGVIESECVIITEINDEREN